MKVMILMRMSEDHTNAAPPSEADMLAMHNYNEALKAAGILNEQLMGGLLPSQFAKRLHFSGKTKNFTVTDGPFTESKEVIAGFALWEVKSMEEAFEWARKNPVIMDCTVDIRPLYEPGAFDPK